MEETDFAARGQQTAWWLLEPTNDITLDETRKLGVAFGWGAEWYQNSGGVPEQLKELWRFIQAQSQVNQLWADLTNAVALGDPYKRADWLKSVAELKRLASATPPAAGSTAPAVRDQLAKRATVAGTPSDEPAAPKRRSAFGRPNAANEAQGDEAADGLAVGQATTTPPEARKASAFPRKAQPVADSTPTSTEAEPGAASSAITEAPPTSEELRESLSGVANDLDITIDEQAVEKLLSDPDLPTKLAAAEAAIEARLEAELEAELAAAESER
jgi:hypothetical protein